MMIILIFILTYILHYTLSLLQLLWYNNIRLRASDIQILQALIITNKTPSHVHQSPPWCMVWKGEYMSISYTPLSRAYSRKCNVLITTMKKAAGEYGVV